MDEKTEISELKWALERQIGWIQSADTKLSVLVPLPTAMLGVLVATAHKMQEMNWSYLVLFVSSACLLIAALATSAYSVIPRTTGPDQSNIFFGKVSQGDASTFRSRIVGRTELDYLDDLAAQVHINAKIASEKHVLIRKATYLLCLSIGPWLGTLYGS